MMNRDKARGLVLCGTARILLACVSGDAFGWCVQAKARAWSAQRARRRSRSATIVLQCAFRLRAARAALLSQRRKSRDAGALRLEIARLKVIHGDSR